MLSVRQVISEAESGTRIETQAVPDNAAVGNL